MLELIDNLNQIATAWIGVMAAVLWQSTVVILVVTVIAMILRRASPGVRYWLWQIVAIKMLLMPFWVLAVPWPFAHWPFGPSQDHPTAKTDRSPLPITPPTIDTFPRPTAPSLPPPSGSGTGSEAVSSPGFWTLITWQAWLFLTWAAVVIWRVASIAWQRYGLSRLLRLTTVADDELTARVVKLSQQLGLRRVPRVLLIDHSGLLFVCGLWNPKLVMPRTLPGTLSAAEMDQVVLHELAHLRRGDLYWGWTIELARIVYFFHPLVYWVGYCLNLERELACDQVAMSVSGHSAGDYAQTLVRVAGHASESTEQLQNDKPSTTKTR
jgi:beta-lactamase regulating signal transducer with metallopeptidase domain